MKCLLTLLIVFSQIQSALSQTVEEVEKRFLTNGAYRYPYYAQEWQTYLDSAIAVLPGLAEFWQLKAMPFFKERKYDVGMVYLDKAVALDPNEYLD